jgi:hypothetical protein
MTYLLASVVAFVTAIASLTGCLRVAGAFKSHTAGSLTDSGSVFDPLP